MPVATLVSRAVAGEAAAWDEIVTRFGRLVTGVARRYRLSPSDVDDVTQRVWLLALTHLGRLRAPEGLPGWLATTTARECLRVVERARRDADLLAAHRRHAVAPAATDDTVLAGEQRDTVRRALSRLSADRRRLVEVVVLDETPYATAAQELGVPLGSLGPTRARCLQALAKAPELLALAS